METFSCICDTYIEPGTRVLVRADCNVPLSGGTIDPEGISRLQALLPTLEYLRSAGARIIIISHLGSDGSASLKPVAEYMNTTMRIPVGFIPEVISDRVKTMIESLPFGGILMLENIRSVEGEMSNDAEFTKQLAGYADIFVNEAFSASHRKHASIVGVPHYVPAYSGIHFEKELQYLTQLLEPEQPFVLVVGGAKFGTKLDLIQSFLPRCSNIIVGGALAHSFYKNRGQSIGASLVDTTVDVSSFDTEKILVPDTVQILRNGSVGDVTLEQITETDNIIDISEKGNTHIWESLKSAKTILWNGPFGYYEGGHTAGTELLAKTITKTSAETIIGGGDTVTVICGLKMEKQFDFVSMAGGAMLDFLLSGILPGIEALEKKVDVK